MKTIFALLAVITLNGCATNTPIYHNDGKQAQSIDCSKGNLTWGDCYKKAGEVCKEAGYDILNKATDESGAIVATGGTLSGGFGATRTLIVRCK
jgi:hypothetical protein